MKLVNQMPNAAGKWGIVIFVYYIVVKDSSVGNTFREVKESTFKLQFYEVPVVTVPHQTSTPGRTPRVIYLLPAWHHS